MYAVMGTVMSASPGDQRWAALEDFVRASGQWWLQRPRRAREAGELSISVSPTCFLQLHEIASAQTDCWYDLQDVDNVEFVVHIPVHADDWRSQVAVFVISTPEWSMTARLAGRGRALAPADGGLRGRLP